jgi:hypothetical protein
MINFAVARLVDKILYIHNTHMKVYKAFLPLIFKVAVPAISRNATASTRKSTEITAESFLAVTSALYTFY